MTQHPPRSIRQLYAAIVSMAPRTVRDRFGREQMRLFDEVWGEAPPGHAARVRWIVALCWRAIVAALGAHIDRWRHRRPLVQNQPRAGGPWLPIFRDAVRTLHRAHWFTLGAVLTFAIGIGLNLAVFAIVDRVLFRPLPFQDPHRLVALFPCDAETGQCYTNMPKSIAAGANQLAR